MLEIYELLDRFELLYSTNSKIGDLRRAYIDQDLSSIFRLLPDTVSGNIEDLRKAVIEKNLHSVFRLVDDDDLRKLILEDNIWKLWPVLKKYVDTQFVDAFKSLSLNDTHYDKDCFSRGQLQSKIWLITELKKLDLDLGTVFLCAGWYATLAVMLFESEIKINKIRSFDLDPTTVDIAEIFNKPWIMNNWKFKPVIEDILNINYENHTYNVKRSNGTECSLTDSPDTIINTSCEHIADFKGWYKKIPLDKIVVIQANDCHEIKEHVNTYNTLEEFSANAPMSKTLFEGQLNLPKYNRFMKIGIK